MSQRPHPPSPGLGFGLRSSAIRSGALPISPAEAQSIHAHAAKEEAFWREIRERTSAGAMRRTG